MSCGVAAIPALAMLAPHLADAATEVQRTGIRESFRLLDAPEAWIVVLLVLPTCAGLAWLVYARESVSPKTRAVLTGLRFTVLLLLLAVRDVEHRQSFVRLGALHLHL